MATSVKDTIIYLRKKLELATDDDSVLRTIHKLSKVPITLDLLQGTGAGKAIRIFAKKEGTVGSKAHSLLNKWREVLAAPPEKQTSSLKENAHPKTSLHNSVTEKPSKTVEIRLKPKHSRDRDDHKRESKKEPREHKHFEEDRTKEKHSKEAKSSHREHSKHSSTSVHKKHRIIETDSPEENPTNYSFGKPEKTSRELPVPKNEFINGDYSDLEDAHCSVFNYKEHSKHSSKSVHKKHKIIETDFPEKNPSKCSIGKPEKTTVRELPVSKNEFINGDYSDLEDAHCSVNYNGISAHTDSPVRESKHLKASTSSKSSHSKDMKTTEHSHKNKLHKESKHKTEQPHKEVKVKTSPKVSTKSDEKLKKLSKKMKSNEEFTSSEISFEDCLRFNDIVPKVKKRKSVKPPSNPVVKKSKNSSKVDDDTKRGQQLEMNNSLIKMYQREPNERMIKEEMEEEILRDLPEVPAVDIISSLPQTLPNYRPLPHRSYETSPVKKKVLSNEEAIKFTSSRREKTAVYSGRKNCFLTSVPTLFECCTRVLIDNIDDIEYMGEIPYFLLESMLKRCSPSQLDRIEHFNPYLLEDTHVLWEKHCKRDYRCAKLQDSETWRELYWRSFEEQERKLKSVTANISASIASSNPMRKAKLAYVDSVAKPPRDVARRQAKNGTALPVTQVIKPGPPSKASPRPTAPVVNAVVNAASTSRARVEVIKPMKPKVAPLMAKTLKSMKKCFRR